MSSTLLAKLFFVLTVILLVIPALFILAIFLFTADHATPFEDYWYLSLPGVLYLSAILPGLASIGCTVLWQKHVHSDNNLPLIFFAPITGGIANALYFSIGGGGQFGALLPAAGFTILHLCGAAVLIVLLWGIKKLKRRI